MGFACVDGSDGTYSCSYNAQVVGLLTLNLKLGSINIPGSPFSVNVVAGENS